MRRLLACILVLCALAGFAAAEEFGQGYDLFQTLYADSINFINTNTGRYLMPLTFTGDFDSMGLRIYVLQSGALSVKIRLDDMASQIASCEITLTAPEGMQYGDARYNDFTVSGYHSYALLMAMHPSDDPVERYALVQEVNNGLAANGGEYRTQVDDYTLVCTSVGNSAVMRFENDLLLGVSMTEEFESTEEEEEDGDLPSIEIKE